MSEKTLKIDGTIRTVEKTDREKKDISAQLGKLVIMNEKGDRVDIKGGQIMLNGFNPEDQVTITVTRTNKTLKEAVEEKRKGE